MPKELFIAIGTCLVITVGTPFAMGLVMLLVPSRKGTMRTTRTERIAGLSADEVAQRYVQRLVREGFTIEPAAEPLLLQATRQGRAMDEIHSHHDKTVRAQIRFSPAPGAVLVEVTVWLKDFVLFDTGEGRVVDQMLDRLTSDTPPATQELVPNRSLMATSSVVSCVVCLVAIPVAAYLKPAGGMTVAAIIAGMGLAGLASAVAAWQATQVIRDRPAEVTGMRSAIAGMILGVIVLAVSATVLAVSFGPTIAEAAREWVDSSK